MAKKKKIRRAKPGVTIRIGNPGQPPITIRVRGRSKKHALARARQFVKRHTKNIKIVVKKAKR